MSGNWVIGISDRERSENDSDSSAEQEARFRDTVRDIG